MQNQKDTPNAPPTGATIEEMTRAVIQCSQRSEIDQHVAVGLLQSLKLSTKAGEEIAVVGMAGRWPGADDIDAFWGMSLRGEMQVRPFPTKRLRQIAPWVDPEGTARLAPGVYFNEIDMFDAKSFQMSERDAELIDPVHRLFMEVCSAAITDAGLTLDQITGTDTGIFAGYCKGSEGVTYSDLIDEHMPQIASLALLGNLPPLLPGRISHMLDLCGPSVLVDTACSSSLTAVHQACQSLRQGDCDIALAGGVKLILWPEIQDDAIGIESADGLTRPFAGGPTSGGTGIGEGAGVIVLKPLSAAIRDNDRIHAVIAGSASNHDGHTSGLAVPSVDRQQDVIEKAWKRANVRAEDIGYVECHGTGTRLGDPIEFEALARAFAGQNPDVRQQCAVGSVKSVLGHLDSAAGVTGLIQAILAVGNTTVPPSRNFTAPNTYIPFLDSPLFVSDRNGQWPKQPDQTSNGGTFAGVSAFSMNGTNCHMIVRKAQADEGRQAPQQHALATSRQPDAHCSNKRPIWFSDTVPQPKAVEKQPDGPSETPGEISRIWQDVLGNKTSADADFFASGGDSLKAFILTSRVSAALNVDVDVSKVWRFPTLEKFEAHVATLDRNAGVQIISKAGPRRDYPISSAQLPIFMHTAVNEDTLYNVPFAIHLTGPLDAERLERIIKQTCAADRGLSVVFEQSKGQVLQKPTRGAACRFERLKADQGATIKSLSAQFCQPFDVSQGPLARFALIERSETDHLLLMDFHHLVVDGVSVSVLWKRIVEAWQSGRAAPPALTALDYAVWRAAASEAGQFTEQKVFWTSYLDSLPDGKVTAIPASTSVIGHRHTVTIDPALTHDIEAFARDSGSGLFATLMAGFGLVLKNTLGAQDINLATPLSGRGLPGTDAMLGMFVNIVPIPLPLVSSTSARALIAGVQERLLEILPHQDFPVIDADDAKAPTYNVAFALQNMELGETDLGDGLIGQPVPFFDLDWNVAKFDFSLFAMVINGALTFSFEYREGGLDAATVQDIARKLPDVLQNMIADPEASLSHFTQAPEQSDNHVQFCFDAPKPPVTESESLS